MTPKEKAQELVNKYESYVCGYVGSSMLTNTEYPEQILKQAKECALIAVDEIIASEPINPNKSEPFGKNIQSVRQNFIDAHDYWMQVKQELEKL